MQGQGRLITLEGLEGSGKTSALATLEQAIRDSGRAVCVTREPGGTPLGERLRALLLDPDATPDPLAELLLIFAARAQHIRDVIAPALAAGTWVLCDRYLDASYAYQGGGRELGSGPVAALERLLSPPQPDLTLLLDLPVATGLARAGGRAPAADRFERESHAFFERVRAAYLARAGADPARIRLIDAGAPRDVVRAALLQALAPWLR